MKTLCVNPFHLKPVIKRGLQIPQKVIIPRIANPSMYDRILSMQNSLNYMTTYYGINFLFSQLPKEDEVHIKCYSDKHFSNAECIISDSDDDAEVARKIYKTASKVI